MKIFHFNKTVSLLMIVAAFSSCSLDVIPTDKYTDKSVWANPASIDLYAFSSYAEFRNFAFGRFFNLGYNNATDAFTDIEKYTSTTEGNGTVNRLAFNPERISETSPGINYWQSAYTRIRRINEFLEGLDKYATGIDSVKKNQYKAEARFIRGFTYFNLVKLHGSVILLEQPTSQNFPRSSEDDCWNFIAKDFAFAAENLPIAWASNYEGRVTKGAAYGMLARTWLYAASIAEFDNKQFNSDALTGIPSAKKTAYYKNASDAAEQVFALENQGYYALENNYANLFKNANSKEALFAIKYSRPNLTHDYDITFTPPKDVASGALVAGVPTAELVDEFEMKDGTKFSWGNTTHSAAPYANREPRFYASILYNGAVWKGGRILNLTPNDAAEGFIDATTSSDPKKTISGYYIKKNLDSANADIIVGKSAQPWMELRLAEIYLIHAEANAKLGNTAIAVSSINKIRNRAGLPNTAANSESTLMAAVEHERKVELAFEGHRYWDLRRWRKAHVILNNTRFHGHKPNANGTFETVEVDVQTRYFPTKLYYLPIPQVEGQRNDKLDQIQGW